MKFKTIPEWVFLKFCAIAIGDQQSGGIAGQAFTEYTCLNCLGEKSAPSTLTPNFCSECTKELIREIQNQTD